MIIGVLDCIAGLVMVGVMEPVFINYTDNWVLTARQCWLYLNPGSQQGCTNTAAQNGLLARFAEVFHHFTIHYLPFETHILKTFYLFTEMSILAIAN